jgi:hypothetical protein
MTRELVLGSESFDNFKLVEVFDYYDGPRFFSVTDLTGQLYIVYWVEESEVGSSWLYVRLSHERYAAMKRGDVSVAEALSKPENGTAFVVTGDDSKQIQAREIQADWMPEGDYRLSLQASTLPVKLVTAVELSRAVNRQVFDIAFQKVSNSYELGARKLGRLMEAFQGAIDALASSPESSLKRVSEEVKNRSELMFTGLFASSFGVRLQTKGTDIFASDDVAIAIESLAKLISALESPSGIGAELHKHNILARSRFKHLLNVLVDSQVALVADWGNPDGRNMQVRASFDQILQSFNALKNAEEALKQTVEHRGRLVGVDIRSNFFAFVSNDGDFIKGALSKALSGENFKIPSNVLISVQETCEVDVLTDKEKWTYLLLSVTTDPTAIEESSD